MNEQINSKFVRLVNNDVLIGELTLKDALRRARNEGLDLVLVSPGDIPICRILDGDHYRFEKKKAEKEIAKRQRELTVDTKEIHIRPVTTDNDLTIKAKKAKEFLENGDKVKTVIKLKGRERSHKDQAFIVLNKFIELLGDHKVEKQPFDGDGDILMILAPVISKSEVLKNKNENNSKSISD